jgi:hypothetical protein
LTVTVDVRRCQQAICVYIQCWRNIWTILKFAPLFVDLNDLPQTMIVPRVNMMCFVMRICFVVFIVCCNIVSTLFTGYLYAVALREHNISVVYHHYDGDFHVMLNFHKEIPLAQQMLNNIRQYVHDVL